MSRKLDVVTLTGEEYDAMQDEISGLRTRLLQKMDDCVTAEQRQKKDADTYWQARESLVTRIEQLHSRNEKMRAALDEVHAAMDNAGVPRADAFGDSELELSLLGRVLRLNELTPNAPANAPASAGD